MLRTTLKVLQQTKDLIAFVTLVKTGKGVKALKQLETSRLLFFKLFPSRKKKEKKKKRRRLEAVKMSYSNSTRLGSTIVDVVLEAAYCVVVARAIKRAHITSAH
jgi:hypothetical protein